MQIYPLDNLEDSIPESVEVEMDYFTRVLVAPSTVWWMGLMFDDDSYDLMVVT